MEKLQDNKEEKLQEEKSMSWEQLYSSIVNKSPKVETEYGKGFSFKEYKKNYPRTFTEMYDGNNQEKLNENGSYEDIYSKKIIEAHKGPTPSEVSDIDFLTSGDLDNLSDTDIKRLINVAINAYDSGEIRDAGWLRDVLMKLGYSLEEFKILMRMKESQLQESENTMKDFENFMNSNEMSSFLETTGAEIISSARQFGNGTAEFQFPNGSVVTITKEGYIRAPNRSGSGMHILNDTKGGTTKLSYQDALSRLLAAYNRNPGRYKDDFEYEANWSWDKDKVARMNDKKNRVANKYKDSKCEHCGGENLSGGKLCPSCIEYALELFKKDKESMRESKLEEGRVKDYLFDIVERKLPDAFCRYCVKEKNMTDEEIEEFFENGDDFTRMAQFMGCEDEFDWASKQIN